MAELDMAAHRRDWEDTASPLSLDAEEEGQKRCEEDVQEASRLMDSSKSDQPTEEMEPPTEGPCSQNGSQLLIKAASYSLPDVCEDEGVTEQQIPEGPGLDVDAASNVDLQEQRTRNEASTSDDTNIAQVDGPLSPIHEDSHDALPDTEDPEVEGSVESEQEEDEELDTEPLILKSPETHVGYRGPVEDIGPVSQETEEQEERGVSGGKTVLAALILVFVAILINHLVQPKPQLKDNLGRIDVFLREMDRMQSEFPHQREDLWTRSRIHLKRHLLSPQPPEPVSLILTAGLGARRTLQCLSQSLASVYSTAVNASVLHIDGASKAHTDSDTVKLEIDSQLQGAFEGDKPVAVIHRFEELPPGSTLIFYRYCDHENAAYKNTFLLFTVLLSEEEIPPKSTLSMVEEMVDDHLQRKFLTDGHPVSFDRMDLDKYGGLWSRISHLILPVVPEDRIEKAGCLQNLY